MPTIRIATGISELSVAEADANMKRTAVNKSSDYTLDATHNHEFHELTGTTATVTLPTVSSSFTETDDWFVDFKNTLATKVTFGRNSQNIDGVAADFILAPYGSIRIRMNAAMGGFYTDKNAILRGCFAYRNSTTSIPNNTATAVLFAGEIRDAELTHSTSSSTSKVIIPAGVYGINVTGSVNFAADATGRRDVLVYKNQAALSPAVQGRITTCSASFGEIIQVSAGDIAVVPGDEIELYVVQSSGGSLNIGGSEELTWLNVKFL